MTTETFGEPAFEARIARLRAAIDEAPAPDGPFERDPDPEHDEPAPGGAAR
jgi:hypothetical protein